MNRTDISQRNYGVDLLRIISMFMVVLLHSLGHGSVIKNTQVSSVAYNTAWLLESAAYCAVNCFALVSGYVGVNSRFKVTNMIVLWLQAVFYHMVFTVGFALLREEPVGARMIVEAFLPAKAGTYWYFSAYLGMFFFTPIINAAVTHMDKRQLQAALLGIVVLFSVHVTGTGVEIFKTGKGYHVLWLLIIYIIGAYIKVHDPLKKWPKSVWLLVYAGAVLLSWGVLLLNNHLKASGGDYHLINLIQYTSPTILLAAVALLIFFSKVSVGGWMKKVVSVLSPLTFGVYLIHEHPLIRERYITNRLAGLANEPPLQMLLKVILFAAAVYCVCSAIDFARGMIFKLLRIRPMLSALESKLTAGDKGSLSV